MASQPECARCRDTAFMRPGARLCTDCTRWVSSLNIASLRADIRCWGASTEPRHKPAKEEEPEDVLARFGFTELSDI